MAAFDAGEPAREVAERFSVRVSFIYKADLRRRRTGETTAGAALPACAAARGAARGDPRPRGAASGCDDGRVGGLAGDRARRASMLGDDLEDARPLRPDIQEKSLRAAEQDRPDVAAARDTWRAAQPGLDPRRLVFVDETWAKTNMTRLRGRSRKGTRLVAAAPHGHWRTSTFLAGLRHGGLVAPAVFDGAINGETFRAYVEQVLAPTLAPGDIVVLDNLASHKVRGIREAIEASGARLLFLRPTAPT